MKEQGFDIVSYLMGKASGGGGGGGGGDVPLLTRAQWNALTTAQKQAYGLVAIQDADSGFDRGELVYGGNYIPTLLPNSVYANILTEVEAQDLTQFYWGEYALQLASGRVTRNAQENAVEFVDGAWGKFVLSGINTDISLYVVFKQMERQNADVFVISVPYASSSGECPSFYCRSGSLSTSVYGSGDTNLNIDATADYHVLTMVLNGSTSSYYVDGVSKGTKLFSRSGNYVALAAALNGGGPIHGCYKYSAIVSGGESEETVIANQQNIMTFFGLGE